MGPIGRRVAVSVALDDQALQRGDRYGQHHNIRAPRDARGLLRRHWTPKLLMSPQARAAWTPPDLVSLPWLLAAVS